MIIYLSYIYKIQDIRYLIDASITRLNYDNALLIFLQFCLFWFPPPSHTVLSYCPFRFCLVLVSSSSSSSFLSGYRDLRPDVEEGICQVLSHMWLESEIMPNMPSTSSYASSSSSSSMQPSKKGAKSEIEKNLGRFFMHQIAHDTSSAYGEGFRAANAAVTNYGLRRTLDHIRYTGRFPE